MHKRELYHIVAEALQTSVDSLTPDSGLNHHTEWDSLAHVRVILALEKRLGITIDDKSVQEYTSMSAITRLATCTEEPTVGTPRKDGDK